jgi:hypothetical protein
MVGQESMRSIMPIDGRIMASEPRQAKNNRVTERSNKEGNGLFMIIYDHLKRNGSMGNHRGDLTIG